MKAIWNDTIIAESDQTIIIEQNHYFPTDSITKEYYKESKTKTSCHWKGVAHYFHLEVNGNTNQDAAWYYPEPFEAAKEITNYIAFWKGVEVK